MRIPQYLPILLLITGVVLLCADTCFAATDTVKQIQTAFQAVGATYGGKLQGYAFSIFKLCLLVDIAVFGVRAALNRGEIGEIISQFFMMLLFAAFCAVAIKYYPDWTHFLLDKSTGIASSVGGAAIELSPMDTGFMILSMINDQCSIWSPIDSLGFYIFGAVILVCLALMTARMLVIVCEAYIAMNASILLLGFGGSSMLKEYAINTMRYAVSVAFKLFVMQLLVAVGISFVTNLSGIDKVTYQDLSILLATAVVLLVLVNTLPETVAGIINGSHVGSGVGIGAAARGIAGVATGAVAGVAAAAVGIGQAGLTMSRAQKIASMEGDGGIAGTASHLWNSFRAARMQDGHLGGIGSTLRRMHANTNDMYHAQQAMKNPDYQANPYASNPYMSPLSNLSSGNASSGEEQPVDGSSSSQ